MSVCLCLVFAEANSPDNQSTNSPSQSIAKNYLKSSDFTFGLFYISNICFRVTLTMVYLQKAQFLPQQQSGVLKDAGFCPTP